MGEYPKVVWQGIYWRLVRVHGRSEHQRIALGQIISPHELEFPFVLERSVEDAMGESHWERTDCPRGFLRCIEPILAKEQAAVAAIAHDWAEREVKP